MGLLPIIGKAIGLFSFLSVTALTLSFILYKLRSPKNKPYNRTNGNPYPAQSSYVPAFQASYYEAQDVASLPRQMGAVASVMESPERPQVSQRRIVQERTDYPERNVAEKHAAQRRPVQQKINERPRSKFQVLHSTEDGEIKAYHLPMRNH